MHFHVQGHRRHCGWREKKGIQLMIKVIGGCARRSDSDSHAYSVPPCTNTQPSAYFTQWTLNGSHHGTKYMHTNVTGFGRCRSNTQWRKSIKVLSGAETSHRIKHHGLSTGHTRFSSNRSGICCLQGSHFLLRTMGITPPRSSWSKKP